MIYIAPIFIFVGAALIAVARLQLVEAVWVESPGWLLLAIGLGLGVFLTTKRMNDKEEK